MTKIIKKFIILEYIKHNILITKLFTSVAIFFIIVISCTEREHTNPYDPYNSKVNNSVNSVLWPLKVGNSWTYEPKYEQSGATAQLVTFRIDSAINIDNQKWYRIDIDADHYIRNDITGLWYIPKYDLNNKMLWFKYPASINEKWTSVDNTIGTLLSDDVTLNLFGNEYDNCLKYEITSPNDYIILYFKPNIGMIQLENHLSDGILVQKLRAYTIL